MREVSILLVILSGGCLFDAGGAVPESVSILLNAVHMKKTLLFSSRSLLTAALFFCAASVVSCQKEETAGAAPSCAAIRLTAEPAELVRTKSETDVAYASRFVEGDAIGLFAVIRTDAETQAYPPAWGNYSRMPNSSVRPTVRGVRKAPNPITWSRGRSWTSMPIIPMPKMPIRRRSSTTLRLPKPTS